MGGLRLRSAPAAEWRLDHQRRGRWPTFRGGIHRVPGQQRPDLGAHEPRSQLIQSRDGQGLPADKTRAGRQLAGVAPDGNVRIFFSGIDKWKQTATDRLLFSYSLDNLP